MTVEQFIVLALTAARERKPEAEQYFKAVSSMAADPAIPTELRALSNVLRRLMMGDTQVDLSELPTPWADLIRKAL